MPETRKQIYLEHLKREIEILKHEVEKKNLQLKNIQIEIWKQIESFKARLENRNQEIDDFKSVIIREIDKLKESLDQDVETADMLAETRNQIEELTKEIKCWKEKLLLYTPEVLDVQDANSKNSDINTEGSYFDDVNIIRKRPFSEMLDIAIKASMSENWNHCIQILLLKLNCESAAYKQLLEADFLRHKESNLLCTAAECGFTELISEFVLHGYPVDSVVDPASQSTMLNIAARHHLDLVSFLLAHGANVEGKHCQKRTPLHSAASVGSVDIVRVLLQAGADINARDSDGSTALHKAVRNEKICVVKLLVSENCNKNIKNNHGDTALDIAKMNKYTAIIEFLVSEMKL